MSDTESFESVMDTLLNGFTHDVRTDELSGSYKMIATRLDRLQAAHNREIRDTAQQQYHRGFEDGRHSMDAEHRVIAMRLRGLRFDGDSHKNLRRIAYAIYPCATGWMCESADGLRDKLIVLMGGVSDESVHVGGLRCVDGCRGDVSNGEDTGRTHDSPSNLDRNHMAVREGVDAMIGDSDDTCDSQCRGACAACDGRDSGEQEEISDGCVDCDILGSDARGHAVDCDFHELGVSDGGTAHDCTADFRGRTGRDVVHLDGLVTYDVLDNERRKAVCELRKCDGGYTLEWDNIYEIFDALGVDYVGMAMAEVYENVRDRLIHLLGGDQPSGIDVLNGADLSKKSVDAMSKRAMEECEVEGRITDELRECIDTAAKSYDNTPWYDMDEGEETDHTTCHITEGELMRIADRIDEQFDRICQQQEAVLQETIDEVVEECGHWKQAVAIKAKALLEISGENVSLEAECEKLERQRDLWHQEATDLMNRADAMEHDHDDLLDLLRDARKEYMRLRTENQIMLEDMRRRQAKLDESEHERDELRRKVDELESFDPETSIAAFGDDNGKLRRTLSRAAALLANAEQDRDANYSYWMDCKEKVVHANATIEELQAKLDAIRDALDG